jgi:hypothetical protein
MSASTHEFPHSVSRLARATCCNVLQSQGDTASGPTCEPLLTEQRRACGGAILAWLEANATRLIVQQIRAGRRRKNRIVLEFRESAGEVRTVGAVSIAGAVFRARVRQAAAAQAAKGVRL